MGKETERSKTIKAALLLSILAGLAAAGTSGAVSRQAQIICSEDVIPEDMVVTATGTSHCANQPLPKDYSVSDPFQ